MLIMKVISMIYTSACISMPTMRIKRYQTLANINKGFSVLTSLILRQLRHLHRSSGIVAGPSGIEWSRRQYSNQLMDDHS